MEICGGYEVLKQFNSTNAICYACQKNGMRYFIKRYKTPMFAAKDDSDALHKKKDPVAKKWVDYRKNVLQRVKDNIGGDGTGSITFPTEFYVDRESGGIFGISKFITIENELDIKSISRLSEEDKLRIMQTTAYSLNLIHKAGLVHLDLKPENIPICKSSSGKLTSKITDLDDALISGEPLDGGPENELIHSTPRYEPLETYFYLTQEEWMPFKPYVVSSLDVFQLGLVFHEWWTGELPECAKYDDFYVVVNECFPNNLGLSASLPQWLSTLITRMLTPYPLCLKQPRPTMEQVFAAIRDKKCEFVTDDNNDAEKERQEKERQEKERQEKERQERERQEKERQERERRRKEEEAKRRQNDPKLILSNAIDYLSSMELETFKPNNIKALLDDFAVSYGDIDSMSASDAEVFLDRIKREMASLEFAYKIVEPLPGRFRSAEIDGRGRINVVTTNGLSMHFSVLRASSFGLIQPV